MNTSIMNEIKRLKFEEFLWIIFIIISILNVYANKIEEKFVETNQQIYQRESNKIFELTLIVTLLIYIYFFSRNYDALKNANYYDKKLYETKLFGSSLLILGVILLIYFQFNQTSFIGAPAV